MADSMKERFIRMIVTREDSALPGLTKKISLTMLAVRHMMPDLNF